MQMPLTLDHLAVAGETLGAATELTESALGVDLGAGGQHPAMGTHNRLIGLDEGLYLEAIAIDPTAPRPDRPRWFDLDRFEGPPRLANWICQTDDIDAVLLEAPGAGRPVELSRGELRWTMLVPDDGILPFDGLFPAVIRWKGAAHPAPRLPQAGCRLCTLELRHPRADTLKMALEPLIDDPRLRILKAPRPAIRARFDTPAGPRWLT
ncbi:MAG: VOC family protein [Brevirhabdus sp.]